MYVLNITKPSLKMSPLSKMLQELRNRRGMRQKELAQLVGYEQSYLSALEIGTKGPPTGEFIDKLTYALNLDEEEQAELETALAMSDRKFVIPVNASQRLYELCFELRQTADQLLPSQIEMMLKVLQLPGELRLENTRVILGKR
jgi:transcriptional regulator with XRE-family HTH domain